MQEALQVIDWYHCMQIWIINRATCEELQTPLFPQPSEGYNQNMAIAVSTAVGRERKTQNRGGNHVTGLTRGTHT